MKRLQGVYLVIDPKQSWQLLLQKLEAALKGGIQVVQIWDHWSDGISRDLKKEFANDVKTLAHRFEVPVLMHDDWQFASEAGLDGVHFDTAPDNIDEVKAQLRDHYIGLTVGNDLQQIRWADKMGLSYISFCAVFPSPSVDSCEIVDQENIKAARQITDLPIFLSGGITKDNLSHLQMLAFEGIAVISGVLSAPDPEEAVVAYLQELKKLEKVSS